MWILLQKRFGPIVSMLSQVCTVHTLTHLPSRVWEMKRSTEFTFISWCPFLFYCFLFVKIPFLMYIFLPVPLRLQFAEKPNEEYTLTVSICAWFLKCQFGSLLQTRKKSILKQTLFFVEFELDFCRLHRQ